MSKARDLAYFNFPIFNGATFDLTDNTLVATLAELNAAISDADVATTSELALKANSTDVATSINNAKTTYTTSVISTGTTAVAGTVYVLTASLTLTLPASPTAGQWVGVVNRSGTATAVVARNSQNIMSLAEDFTVDINNFSAVFIFADATRGWVVL